MPIPPTGGIGTSAQHEAIANYTMGRGIMTDSDNNFESINETKRKKGNPAWQKGGVSPNPGGRPAVIRDLREAAQGYSEEALTVLAGVMRDAEAPHAARVAAVRELLDRGFGKAVQAVDVNSKVDVGKAAAQVLMDLTNKAKIAKASDIISAEYRDVTPVS